MKLLPSILNLFPFTIAQILMNVLRTLMTVCKTAQTLMALSHVPVKPASVYSVMGGAVKVLM